MMDNPAWFGTRAGACTFDGEAFIILKNEHGNSFGNVRSIIEDKGGNVWLGGSNGLWRYDGRTLKNFTTNFVSDVMEDKEGNIWTCSANDRERGWAVSYYSAGSSFSKETTLVESDNMTKQILCIFEDVAGNIWFGSFGVYRYDGLATAYFAPN